jgi:hypothetical protein
MVFFVALFHTYNMFDSFNCGVLKNETLRRNKLLTLKQLDVIAGRVISFLCHIWFDSLMYLKKKSWITRFNVNFSMRELDGITSPYSDLNETIRSGNWTTTFKLGWKWLVRFNRICSWFSWRFRKIINLSRGKYYLGIRFSKFKLNEHVRWWDTSVPIFD